MSLHATWPNILIYASSVAVFIRQDCLQTICGYYALPLEACWSPKLNRMSLLMACVDITMVIIKELKSDFYKCMLILPWDPIYGVCCRHLPCSGQWLGNEERRGWCPLTQHSDLTVKRDSTGYTKSWPILLCPWNGNPLILQPCPLHVAGCTWPQHHSNSYLPHTLKVFWTETQLRLGMTH